MQYLPHAKQIEVHNTDKNRMILNWGRQTGKTVLAVNYTWIEAVKKQGRYFIVFPTYQQAYDALWSQYISFIPKELIQKVNEKRLTITLKHLAGTLTLPDGETVNLQHDVDAPPSTIELKGSDSTTADRLRGAKVQGFVFDEYAIHDPEAWETVFEPMMATTDGWAMFISSPQGFNHFYDLWEHAGESDDWFRSHATGYDNPNVKRDFLEKKRRDAEEKGRNAINKYHQEYMAEFKQRSGLVYPDFDREVHIVEPHKVPTEGTRMVSVDFGFTNPTAIGFFLIDYDQNWWLYDEVYERQRTMDEIVNIIRDKTQGQSINFYVGDSAQAEHIENLRGKAIPITPIKKRKDSIQLGIDLCAELLKPREQLTGKPKPKFFVAEHCKHFVEEIEQYKYPEKRPEKNEKEDPIKENDHLMDAWRYARLFMQEDVNHEWDFPEQELFSKGGFYV